MNMKSTATTLTALALFLLGCAGDGDSTGRADPGTAAASGVARVEPQPRDYKALTYRGEPLPLDPQVQEQLRHLWQAPPEAGQGDEERMMDVLIDDDGMMGHLTLQRYSRFGE